MSSLPSGRVSSRSRVPVVRSRRTVIELTRNIEISGNRPTSGGPTRSNCAGRPSNRKRRSTTSRLGTAISSATVRGRDERVLEVLLAGSPAQAAGRVADEDLAVAHQDEAVAVPRLLEAVARDEQRRARRREAGEQPPQPDPPDPGEADPPLV